MTPTALSWALVTMSVLAGQPPSEFGDVLRSMPPERQGRVRELLHNIDDPRTEVYGIIELRALKLPAEQGAPIFGQLLTHRSEFVRRSTVQTLGETYPRQSTALLPDIVRLIRTGETSVLQAEAITAGAKINPQNAALLAAVQEHLAGKKRSEQSSIAALNALLMCGPEAKPAEDIVRRCLSEPYTSIRFHAYQTLPHIQGVADIPLEKMRGLKRIPWQDAEVGFVYFRTLQKAGRKVEFAVPLLLEALAESPPPHVLAHVVQTIARISPADEEALQAILDAACTRRDEFLAQVGQKALEELDREPATVRALAGLLKHPNRMFSLKITTHLLLLGQAATPAVPAIGEEIKNFDPAKSSVSEYVLQNYLKLLKKLGNDAKPATSALVSLLPEKSALEKISPESAQQMRAQVFLILAQIGVPSEAVPYLLDSLSRGEPGMIAQYAAAARAAGRLPPAEARLAIPPLMRALRADFQDARLNLDDKPAMAFSRHLIGDTSGRHEAIRALAQLGPAAHFAVPELRKLAEREPAWREEVQRTLKAIQQK